MHVTVQLPGREKFKPNGEPTSVAQRWERWIKSFEYFITAFRHHRGSQKESHTASPSRQRTTGHLRNSTTSIVPDEDLNKSGRSKYC